MFIDVDIIVYGTVVTVQRFMQHVDIDVRVAEVVRFLQPFS